jgi:protein tyrosine/serine phosphatase
MKKLPILESYWVEENRFLAGEYPGGFDSENTRRRMDAFLEAGVNTFIDLTQPNELMPYENILKEQAEIYGVNASYHRFPIRDYSVPSSETMTAILNTIDKSINGGGCVYVHCWGGVGRTGMAVGCYLIRHGKPNEEAVAQVDQLYKTRPANIRHPRSPETDEQIEFVRNWWDDPDTLNRNAKSFCEG